MSEEKYIQIVPSQLSKIALEGLIKEFILREGTDYGLKTYTIEEKIEKIQKQLNSGRVVIVYDTVLETTTLIKSEDLIS